MFHVPPNIPKRFTDHCFLTDIQFRLRNRTSFAVEVKPLLTLLPLSEESKQSRVLFNHLFRTVSVAVSLRHVKQVPIWMPNLISNTASTLPFRLGAQLRVQNTRLATHTQANMARARDKRMQEASGHGWLDMIMEQWWWLLAGVRV